MGFIYPTSGTIPLRVFISPMVTRLFPLYLSVEAIKIFFSVTLYIA